jgi:catecholate siderophore receptor
LRTLFVLLAAACAASQAQGAAAAAENAFEDNAPIIVTGRRDALGSAETVSGTKTKTPIIDVPQAISVLSESQIRDEAIVSVSDLVRHVPGVSAGQGEGHRDQITLRGNASTADFFINGLRDDVQYFRSFYNIASVEVLKGPNAMIFGRGGGGGVLNRVTKEARSGENFGAAYGALNSFGDGSLATDGNIALSETAAFRLNGYYENLANHRDNFSGKRYAANPVLGARIGPAHLQFGYEYVHDDRVVDRGIPSQNGLPLVGYRDDFFGVPGVNRARLEAHIASFRADVALNPALAWNTSLLHGDYDKSYSNAYAATPVGGTSAAPTLGIEAYRDGLVRHNFIAQTNFEWTGMTGPIKHVLLLGAEVTNQKSRTERVSGFFNPLILTTAGRRVTVPLSRPLTIPTISFVAGPAGATNRKVSSTLSQQSVYVQDQLSFGDHIIIIGGLRFDRFNLQTQNLFTGQAFARVDAVMSPRFGLVIKPRPSLSFYASRSKSYLPQSGDQFASLDATLSALDPETFNNFEIGMKWDIQPALSFTVAAYRLDRTNTRAAGATPGTTVLTGAQRSKGIETSLVGKLNDRWQVSLGYAYTQAVIRQTTLAAPAGRRVAQVPKHQVTLWNRFDVSDHLGFGLGLYHQSKSFASISNSVTLPAYTQIDLAAFITLSPTLSLQFNAENLLNARTFPTAQNDNNISTGAPLNLRMTLGFKF